MFTENAYREEEMLTETRNDNEQKKLKVKFSDRKKN